MKLKLTVGGTAHGDTDVLVTADVTATVGEVARTIVLGQPGAPRSPLHDVAERNLAPLTLRVQYPNLPQVHVLDTLATLGEAGLQSGCWVHVIRPDQAEPTDVYLYERAAVATILDGPHAGLKFGLVPGRNLVGRSRGCRVHLLDKSVSRLHAAIEVDEAITIHDLDSGNGLYVDGEVVRSATLTDRSVVAVGGTTLSIIRLPHTHRAPTSDAPHTVVEFARSPRVDERFTPTKIPAPVPPRRPEPQKLPILALMAPLIMGVVLFAVTRNLLSIVFVALSPLMMLGTFIDGAVTNRRKKKEGAKQFAAALELLRSKLVREREKEVAVRNTESPSTVEVAMAMIEHEPLLWARRAEHQSFLEMRLGIGEQPSRITVEIPARSDSDESYWAELDEVSTANATVEQVPVLEKFDRAGNIGVAGESEWSDGVLRSLIIQLCGLHSPADLVLTSFCDRSNEQAWRWLKWLPQVGSVYSPLGVSHLAADEATAGHLLAELEETLERRKADSAAGERRVRSHLSETNSIDELHGMPVTELPLTPVIVVVVVSDTLVDRGRLVALAEEGPDFGIHLLWQSARVAELPAACRTYIDVQPNGTGVVGFVRSGIRTPVHPLEILVEADATRAARRLSPVLDSGARELDESDLPANVNYQELQSTNVITSAEAVAALWSANNSITSRWAEHPPQEAGSLAAMVGQGVSGVLRLDLREHGPHALVGGTTGSGKSEFLQTWIMSLASEYSPDRVTFLLVDYKGGAAFAECTGLPHTVGLVTDLNPHLVRRALTSLRAELHYRETLLNEKGAKDLISLEKRGDPDTPPSLIIVIDEFAALVGEVPEFVDGVVDVAQRGRSLGLHLVMATQRPAGVIKDNLRANTNLRIALRVADEADSADVIGTKDAAGFDPGTPGRGAAKLGPGKLIHFQTGYLGGRSKTVAVMPDIDVAEFPFTVGESWTVTLPTPPVRAEAPRDIENMLSSICRAADAMHITPPRKPWLGQLDAVIDLADIPASRTQQLSLGRTDEPERQRQSTFRFDPDAQGNLSFLGTSGAGKTAALRTLAIAASQQAPHSPVHIYGLDFGGGALGMLGSLPTVGAIISADDHERVGRLIRTLTALATERSARYSAIPAATLTEYRNLTGTQQEPRIVVLIDGMANFRSAYEYRSGDDTFTALAQLLSVGRQVGIHFVFTADRPGVIPTVLSANIQQSVVMRLASSADYGILGVPTDILDDAPAGRAVVDGLEVQLAITGGTSSVVEQSAAIEEIAAALRHAQVPDAPRIERLPTDIDLDSLPVTVGDTVAIGVGDLDLQPVGIAPEGLVVVSGPFRSGKTSTLETLIHAFARAWGVVHPVLLSPRSSSALRSAAPWAVRSLGVEEAEAAARDLTAVIRAGGAEAAFGSGRRGFIIIESSGDFEGSPAEGVIAGLIKVARKAGILTVVETDAATGPAAWQIFSELKTARTGIVLQPDEGDGIALFRVAFPRANRTDFPEGRGFVVEAGRATKVQLARVRAEETPAE